MSKNTPLTFGYKRIYNTSNESYYFNGTVRYRGVQIVPDERNSVILKDIFDSYLRGLNTHQLVKYIKEKYNYNLSKSSVCDYLKNKFYIGIIKGKHGDRPHNFIQIIDKDIFDKVQKKLSLHKRSTVKSSKAYESFLQKAIKGECFGSLPFGYKYIGPARREKRDSKTGKKYSVPRAVILESEKKNIISEVYSSYIAGKRKQALADYINQKFSINITAKFLYHILNNHFYYGMLRLNGQLYPHKYEPVIDEDTFITVQNLLSQNNRKKVKEAPRMAIVIKDILVEKEKKSQNPILAFCLHNQRSLEEIIEHTQESLEQVQQKLLQLELSGEIQELFGLWKTII